MDGEEYRGHSEALGPLMAVVCKCQRDTDNTGGNGYGQPQAVAERCDVAIPHYVRVVGQTYKHIGAERQTYGCDSKCLSLNYRHLCLGVTTRLGRKLMRKY